MSKDKIEPEMAPVVHAHWIEAYVSFTYPKCSVCGKEAMIPIGSRVGVKLTPYCPNCGAKMDEVNKNDDM